MPPPNSDDKAQVGSQDIHPPGQMGSQFSARMESEKAEWETKGNPHQAVSEEQVKEQDIYSTLL